MMARLSASAARKLHEEFKQGFIVSEQKFKEFLEGEGWIGMGYETYSSYQSSELSGISLLRQLHPAIVYQMFSEGKSDTEVAIAVKDVGPEEVRAQRRNYDAGLPPEIYERGHMRKPSGDTPNALLKFKSIRERKRAEVIAKQNGHTLSEYARRLVLGIDL